MILYDFRQEAFNDALFFLEQAQSVKDPNLEPFRYWRYCKWSVMTSAIFMESYLISHIRAILNEIDPELLSIFQKNPPKGFRSGFYANLKLLEFITDSIIMDDTNHDWKSIGTTVTLRNHIAHFKEGVFPNSLTLENAETAVISCRLFVKKFHTLLGDDYTKFAPWIDKQSSDNYDIPYK